MGVVIPLAAVSGFWLAVAIIGPIILPFLVKSENAGLKQKNKRIATFFRYRSCNGHHDGGLLLVFLDYGVSASVEPSDRTSTQCQNCPLDCRNLGNVEHTYCYVLKCAYSRFKDCFVTL